MKPNWKKHTHLDDHYWIDSVAELDGNVYMTVRIYNGSLTNPYVYNFKEVKFSKLSALPFNKHTDFCLVAVHKIKRIMAIGGVTGYGMCKKVLTLNDNSWSNEEYPDMPTARSRASSISYESSVIVAGGITEAKSLTITKAVEVLKIHDRQWYVVDRLPYVVYNAIPLIIGDSVYFGVGYDNYIKIGQEDDSTCNIVKASVSDLLKRNDENMVGKSPWKKLPDMPYSSWSINHYKNHLIAFTGDSLVQPSDKDETVCQNVPLIYIYNPNTFTWDCVDDLSGTIDIYLGRSIHINENTILFMGGIAGKHESYDDIVTACYTLTFEP